MNCMLKAVKALADESRLSVIWMLEEKPLCVCEIKETLGLAQSTVSRHLILLEDAGLIVSEKEGQWKNYRINPAPSATVGGLLAVVRLAAQTDPAAQKARERSARVCRLDICARGG